MKDVDCRNNDNKLLLKICYVLAIKRLWEDNNRIDVGDDSEILGKQTLKKYKCY